MDTYSIRRPNGMGSIRQRENGRWEARYTIGTDPITGKQLRKSIYRGSEKEARLALIRKLSELDEISDVYSGTEFTLDEWLEIWLQEYSLNKKYSTLKGYRAQIKKHITPALGNYKLRQLTPFMIQRFLNHLSQEDENGKMLAPKSVKNVYAILNAALSQALENGYIKRNPCKNAKLPQIEKALVKPLSDQQIKAFLKLSENEAIYGKVLRLILFTGLREGEAIGLTWDNVDFEKGVLVINKQLQHRPRKDGGCALAPVKNGKARMLIPAPYVMHLLKERYHEQISQSLEAGDKWIAWTNETEHRKALIFTNELGRHLIPKRVYLRFKRIAKEFGAPEARVHDLRHTYAVLSLQNGDDIKTIQTNLGHASAAFTLDVYGHVSNQMQRKSSTRMENYIQSLKSE